MYSDPQYQAYLRAQQNQQAQANTQVRLPVQQQQPPRQSIHPAHLMPPGHHPLSRSGGDYRQTTSYATDSSPPTPQAQQAQAQQAPPVMKSMLSVNGFANDSSKYNGLDVFEQAPMKRSLDAEKVDKVDSKTFNAFLSTTIKTREEIDKSIKTAPVAQAIPKTIKVDKAPPVKIEQINNKRAEELRNIEMKKSDTTMLTAMAIKKKSADQTAREMEELMKRRRAEMQNIQYK